MTRTFNVTLASHTTQYNLWTLIKPSDPTMSNSPYVPNMAKKLTINFPVNGPLSTNNPGANVSVQNSSGAEMRSLAGSDQWQMDNVDLTRIQLQGDTDNVSCSIIIGF